MMKTLEYPQQSYLEINPIETLPRIEAASQTLKRRSEIGKMVSRILGATSLTILFACPSITLLHPIGEIPWSIATGLIILGFGLLCGGSR